jgi:hypothetical protein
MSLTPLTRENMREIKARKDAELNKIKNAKIDSIVKEIYTHAVKFAEITDVPVYKARINNTYGTGPAGMSNEFIIAHMKEILKGLQALFPDSSVEYKKVAVLKAGEYDDSTPTNPYNSILVLDNEKTKMDEFIVIDWT